MKIQVTAQIKKKKNVFTATSPLLVLNDSRSLMMLELCGPDTAIQAIWANIVKGRNSRDGTQTDVKYFDDTDGSTLCVIEKEKYLKKSWPGRLLIYAKAFGEKQRTAFLGGTYEEPPIHFMDAFKAFNQNIPFLPHHDKILWKMALEIKGVKPLQSFSSSNIGAWQICECKEWPEAIKKEVLNGTISGN